MGRVPERYREVVQRALEFMRSSTEPLTVVDVARHTGCCASHLRDIFHAVTGKGVLPSLNEVRIEKARNLLLRTSLSVGAIADAIGFERATSFTKLFRKVTGTSPSLYRRAIQETAGTAATPLPTGPATAATLVRDDFTSDRLAGCWIPEYGRWTTHNGCLRGGCKDYDAILLLTTPLPENFRVEFDVQIRQATAFRLHLRSADGRATYAQVALPLNQGPGSLAIRGRTMLSVPEAFLRTGYRHTLRMELSDNRITLLLDGKNVFSFRDIFPPGHADRDHLAFLIYEASVELYRFRLRDLGFLPVAPAIRQGDAFFNAGMYQQARDFYVRHLLPNIADDAEMELRFKIGVCMLQQNEFDHCRGWIEAALPLAKSPFWKQECTLLLVRLEADAHRIDAFGRRVREAMTDPSLHDGLRPLIMRYYAHLRDSGFYDQALRIGKLAAAMDKDRPDQVARAADLLAGALKNLKRLPEAKRHLQSLIRSKAAVDSMRSGAYISLSDICLLRGQVAAARKCVAEMRAQAAPIDFWREIQEAHCLRTERRFREAVDFLLSFRSNYPEDKALQFDAAIEAAEILCCLGDLDAARRLDEKLRAEFPKPPLRACHELAGIAKVMLLAQERYEEAASLFLKESRRPEGPLTVRGQEAVVAGILFELAGRPDEARKVWLNAIRRFPSELCCFWGALATALAAGKPDHLEKMPFFYRVRSEMFYLVGLLHKRRGNAARARRLFTLSCKEDPTFNWAAHLAMKRLSAKTA